MPGRSANSEIHSAPTRAVTAAAAMDRCSTEACSPVSRSGAIVRETSSRPCGAPATPVLPREKWVQENVLASCPPGPAWPGRQERGESPARAPPQGAHATHRRRDVG